MKVKHFFIVFAALVLFSCTQNNESTGTISITLPDYSRQNTANKFFYKIGLKQGNQTIQEKSGFGGSTIIFSELESGVYSLAGEAFDKDGNLYADGETKNIRVTEGENTEAVLELSRISQSGKIISSITAVLNGTHIIAGTEPVFEDFEITEVYIDGTSEVVIPFSKDRYEITAVIDYDGKKIIGNVPVTITHKSTNKTATVNVPYRYVASKPKNVAIAAPNVTIAAYTGNTTLTVSADPFETYVSPDGSTEYTDTFCYKWYDDTIPIASAENNTYTVSNISDNKIYKCAIKTVIASPDYCANSNDTSIFTDIMASATVNISHWKLKLTDAENSSVVYEIANDDTKELSEAGKKYKLQLVNDISGAAAPIVSWELNNPASSISSDELETHKPPIKQKVTLTAKSNRVPIYSYNIDIPAVEYKFKILNQNKELLPVNNHYRLASNNSNYVLTYKNENTTANIFVTWEIDSNLASSIQIQKQTGNAGGHYDLTIIFPVNDKITGTITAKIDNKEIAEFNIDLYSNLYESFSELKKDERSLQGSVYVSGEIAFNGSISPDNANDITIILLKGTVLKPNGTDSLFNIYDNEFTLKGEDDKEVAVIDGNSINGNNPLINVLNVDTLTIKNIYIKNYKNTHALNFGAICITEGNAAYIENCVFENIEAKKGGAIYISNPSSAIIEKISISNCEFKSNKANVQNAEGGAIYITDTTAAPTNSITISNCKFKSNTAKKAGGAIYISGASSADINDCSFENNETEFAGGAIYLTNEVSEASLLNCIFKSNKANKTNGGAIILANSGSNNSTVRFGNCSFKNNYAATGYGGALYIDSRFTVKKVEKEGIENYMNFEDNTALSGGKDIYINSSDSSVFGKLYLGNGFSSNQNKVYIYMMTNSGGTQYGAALYETEGIISSNVNFVITMEDFVYSKVLINKATGSSSITIDKYSLSNPSFKITSEGKIAFK